MPNTEPMTQRVELATVMDRLAVDALVTDYAVAVDDGDWEAYRGLFTSDGRADYRSAGGVEETRARSPHGSRRACGCSRCASI